MSNKELNHSIIEGIQKKKGKGIVNINLEEVENSICQNFIICHGDSTTQTGAIAESVEDIVNENLNMKAFHKEGYENGEWILLDYLDTLVHVFQENIRTHYKLEELWADGVVKHIESD
jgi:ribosome-associated protein